MALYNTVSQILTDKNKLVKISLDNQKGISMCSQGLNILVLTYDLSEAGLIKLQNQGFYNPPNSPINFDEGQFIFASSAMGQEDLIKIQTRKELTKQELIDTFVLGTSTQPIMLSNEDLV